MAITDIAAYMHLTAADIKSLERELDEIRRDVEDSHGASLDVIAALRGIRRRTLSPAGAIITGGGAALFAGLGVAALAAQGCATAP